MPGPQRDAEAAYRWYYVACAQQGYLMAFDDRNDDPPYYGGPVGDFRNESQIGELVTEIGFDRVRELDAAAAAWITERGIGHPTGA